MTTEALELAILQEAEELALQREGQVSDLVEEERAAVCGFEFTFDPAIGAGEGAPLVAEQLAFDQPVRQAGAVDVDHRPIASVAVVVNRSGDERFSSSSLSTHQDSGVRGCGRHDAPIELDHGPGLADDVVERAVEEEAAAPVAARPHRRQLQRLSHLVGEVEQPLLIVVAEGAFLPVQHLQYAPERSRLVADGHGEHVPRAIAGHLVDAGKEPLVFRDVGEHHRLARLGHVARDATTWRQSDLVDLGQVGHPAPKLTRYGVDEIDGASLGVQLVHDPIDHGSDQTIPRDLPREHVRHRMEHRWCARGCHDAPE